ncbi:MAG: single-stranded DNA-binding protein [Rickettsiales bacterium]|nr:single-stranded DNA-binding protein [Rickettsiales bacterium]
MAGSLNKVLLIGNLGKDPEIRSTGDGREVANFVIATNEYWTDKNTGEKKEKTEWHRVACFNPALVNVCKNFLKKGSKIFVEGQLQTRKWQDQQGQERYTTEVILQGYNCNITMLDRLNDNNPSSDYSSGGNSGYRSSGGSSARQQNTAPADSFDDDIPF